MIEYSQFQFINPHRAKLNIIDITNEAYQNDNDLIISIIPGSIFSTLSSLTPFSIEHGFEQLTAPAPTLEQYYQQFKVFIRNLDLMKEINYKPTKRTKVDNFADTSIIETIRRIKPTKHYYTREEKERAIKRGRDELYRQFEPSIIFWSDVEENFITSKAAWYKRDNIRNNSSFVYWYHRGGEKLTLIQAKRIYCDLYAQRVINEPIFQMILEQLRINPKLNVIVYSYGALNGYRKINSADDMRTFYYSNYDFPDCYCLCELLVNRGNVNECIWSKPLFVDVGSQTD